jgi:hypothetical protein
VEGQGPLIIHDEHRVAVELELQRAALMHADPAARQDAVTLRGGLRQPTARDQEHHDHSQVRHWGYLPSGESPRKGTWHLCAVCRGSYLGDP